MNLLRRSTSATTSRRQQRRTRIAQGLAIGVVASTVVVLAVKYDGSPIHDVKLNDGAVWVSNSNRGTLGRLNSQVKELDLAIATTSTSNTVFQQGNAVQVFDDGGGADSEARSVSVIDVVTGLALTVPLAGNYDVAAAASTVVIHDNDTGKVWIRSSDQLEGFDGSVAPDLEVAERSAVAVTRSGTALVSDRAKGEVSAWGFSETGTVTRIDSYDFDTEFTDDSQLTAVGEIPVALQEGKVYAPGEAAVEVPGSTPSLQQPGPASDDVYVASDQGMFRVSLSGGDAHEISGLDVAGSPAAPVFVDGCVHGAWNDPGQDNYAMVCGDDEPVTARIPDLSPSATLVFRTNRSVVVLNDVVSGDMWLVQEGMQKLSDWESVNPKKSPQKAEADDKAVRDRRNDPPEAKPDTFGVRAGKTAVLPVTLNDIDTDGDILVISDAPAPQGDTSFSLVGEDTQIQARIGPKASGEIVFRYKITDGQSGHAPSEAKVTLQVKGPDTDTAPKRIQGQHTELKVASGHRASVNVLGSFIDPEGDSPVLTEASAEGGEVGFRPDGTIDFTDDGRGGKSKTVNFTIKGGKATKDHVLDVSVLDPDKAEPTTVADHFSGTVGSRILLEPLTNDTDPLGAPMSLARIRNVSGRAAMVTLNGGRGNATFSAPRPGSYYLEYTANASNGVAGDKQLIRVDVAPGSGENHPPVAMRDTAALRPGGSTLVDVLANDTDPDGDVMVVQGVRVDNETYGDTIKASLVNRRFVRVEASAEFEGMPEIEYQLSDGRSDQVTGTVAVASADGDDNAPPVAVEDVVNARAGTVITVPVLDNDEDPDGDRLTVSQQDLFDVDPTSTVISDHTVPVIASGSEIKVLVPDDGTTRLQIGYGVRDADQARGDSRLVLNIKPDNAKDNQKPQPRPIVDRTVTGQRIRVDVGTFGGDPDGDPLVLAGIATSPKLGRIVAMGADWFDYEPLEGLRNTGTDAFKVEVADPYGLLGTTDVRIGVAQPALENQSPAALDDDILVKPGLTVQYPILDNDSDPDGDPLIITDDDIFASPGTVARLAGTAIEVETPDARGSEEANQAVQYVVRDGLGGSASALLRVTARKDAPDHAPIARDDVVTVEQLRGKTKGDTVDVDVLKNDGDLDGPRSALEIEPVDQSQASVVERKLKVTLRGKNQVIPYRVTDGTGQVSFGFVYVNGVDEMPPMIDTSRVPVEVTAGEKKAIELSDVVIVRPGHQPFVGNVNEIAEVNGDAKRKGAAALEWHSPQDYFGPASVTLPVLDEQSYNTPGVLSSQLTIPINVMPADNVPPSVRNTAVTLTAGAGPVVVLLDRLATDPNPKDSLDFEVGKTPTGVSADLRKSRLTLEADPDAPSSAKTLKVKVSDGKAPAVTAQIRLTVIGVDENTEETEELKPPMRLNELHLADGHVGEPMVVDVRDAVLFDPYPGEAKSLTTLTAGGASASVAKAGGSKFRVTPRAAGEVVVNYGLQDGSDDSTRVVNGRVLITVAGKPGRPGTPRGVEGGPDSVQLTWTAPADDGGSDIISYKIEGNPGGNAECGQTQCTVTDLKPGTAYKFRVVATNAEGDSEPSGWSQPVTPDEAPGKMEPPVVISTAQDRNGQLKIRWKLPPQKGSDVTHFKIEVDGNGPSVPDPRGGQTQAVISGLDNGTEYRIRMLAANADGEGVVSDWSAPDHPFTVPDVMPAPRLTSESNGDGNGKGYLKVSWDGVAAPQDGGDPVTGYTVRLLRDGAELLTQPQGADTTTATFDVENGHGYSAQVRATNAAGNALEFSPQAESVIAWDPATAVTGIGKVDDCDGKCSQSTTSYFGRVKFTTPQDNGGYEVVKYKWETPGKSGVVAAPTSAQNASAQLSIAFSSSAANQSVKITPITRPPGVGETAGVSASGGDFDPYALPPAPTGSSSGGYMSATVKFGCSNGNGRPVTAEDFPERDAGGSVSGCTISWSGIEGGSSKCSRARVKNAAGWSARSSSACGRANARTVQLSYYYYGSCPFGTCDGLSLALSGFLPGSYSAQPWENGGVNASCGAGGPVKWDSGPRTVRVGSDGRYSGRPGAGGDDGGGGRYYVDKDCKSTNKWVVDGESSPWVKQ